MSHAEKIKGQFCKYLCDFVASFKPGVQCLHTCLCLRALQEAAVIVPLGTGGVQLSRIASLSTQMLFSNYCWRGGTPSEFQLKS